MTKKIPLIVVALAACAVAGFAQDAQNPPPDAGQDQLTASGAEDMAFLAELQQMAGTQLGTLTVADLARFGARFSVAQQRLMYVRRASLSSFMFPGAGQLMTGNTLAGALFITGDLAVITGALVGAYFLLPADLQFTSLNYLTAPLGSLETAWKNHSIDDYLPTAGVLAGGMLLRFVLGHVSARLAAQEARQNIADGKVQFTPRMELMGNGLMMGMRMRM